jgi:hypothetical protein
MSEEALAHAYAQSVLYHRERVKLRRIQIDIYKMARGCADCGYNVAPEALDFDHEEPSLKIKDISSMMNHGWDKVLAELEKCTIRCACCHRIKTHRKPDSSDGTGLSSRLQDHPPGRRSQLVHCDHLPSSGL